MEVILLIAVSDAIHPNLGSCTSSDFFAGAPTGVSSTGSSPATNFVRLVSRAFQKLSPPFVVFLPNQDDFSVKLSWGPSASRSVKSRSTAIVMGLVNIDPRFSFCRVAPIDSQYFSDRTV